VTVKKVGLVPIVVSPVIDVKEIAHWWYVPVWDVLGFNKILSVGVVLTLHPNYGLLRLLHIPFLLLGMLPHYKLKHVIQIIGK